ncbi:hypothetical protein [Calothrix rhizosoleniae]|uniref:hypothetical protein n=1 Tax=Calothrix rhizosoleniae TaxID=888997 RepID=UPI000B4A294F|nr:hypothetical protein [Calothrix rhizosoleniae]
MFPFWFNPCLSSDTNQFKTHQERKLKFLKMMRDGLEARLAALNAAIETIERQMRQEDTV